MSPRRLVDRRQVRLSRKQRRDDTRPMSPVGCLVGCFVSFLLILTRQILTCPMSLLSWRTVSGRLSPVGFPLTERCCRGECQQSGRMMAPDPRFHRSNYSPTIAEEITHRQRWLLPTVGKFPIDSGHLFTPAPTSLLLLRCLSILID